MPSNVRANFTASEPGGGRATTKWYGIDAKEHADLLNDLNTYVVRKDVTSTSGFGWVVDEDNMASNLATKVPTQQSVKAYVDAASFSGGGGEPPIAAASPNPTLKYWRGDKTWQTLNQDVVPDGTTNKAYSSADKSKLAAIEANADVTDAANVDAAGAVMNSDTSTVAMNFVVDEDNMTSNSAIKVPTQQSVKAYVDSSLSVQAQADLEHFFTSEADGAPDTIVQSNGMPIHLSYTDATAQATILNGELINPDTTGASSAIYWTAGLSDGDRIIWAKWWFRFFDDGGTTSTEEVCCVLWESFLASGAVGGSNRSPAHIISTRNALMIQTYDSGGGGATDRATPVAYASSLPQGVLLSLEISIDVANNKLTIVAPDGVTREFTDSNFSSIPAYYVCCESLIVAPSTDDNVGYQRVQADSVIGGRNPGLLGDPTQAAGDLLVNNGVAVVRKPVGTDGKVLTADSTKPDGLDYKTPYTSPLTTAGDLVVRDGTGTTRKAVGSNKQILRVNTANGDKLEYVDRVQVDAQTSTTSWTINADTTDFAKQTALAGALTVNAPSGSPQPGQKLLIRLKDNGTARAITWNAIFRAIGITLPTTTVVSKIHYIGCVYNSDDTKWDAIAVAQEA